METLIAASEQSLVHALSFSAPKIASYVTGRKQVTLSAAGGDVYGPSGVGSNTVRFSLNTSGPFLDLSTLCISSTLLNRGTTNLRILGPNIGACITSMRILIGGQEVDYVQYSNRTEAMLSLLQSEGKQRQAYSEGFWLEAVDEDLVRPGVRFALLYRLFKGWIFPNLIPLHVRARISNLSGYFVNGWRNPCRIEYAFGLQVLYPKSPTTGYGMAETDY